MLLFMARAAHQLKTPVAAIQATLDALVRKERSREELLQGLGDLGIGVKQMNQLTRKLIASSRIRFETKNQRVRIDLGNFFANQLKLFHYQARNKSLTWQIDGPEKTVVAADEYLLSEIFGNLIENAVLYSISTGRISIRWQQQGRQTIIEVSDQGPGFIELVKNHLFEPFLRGDERLVGGSGLGLSIVKSAVQSLSGSIELVKSDSQGSIIQVILPSA